MADAREGDEDDADAGAADLQALASAGTTRWSW